MIILPVFGLLGLLAIEDGYTFTINILGLQLTPVRVDRLSLLFGYIFHIAAIISIIYAFHLRDTVQQIAALMYAGTAIGGIFAGDLVSLFVYWEGTAISSVFLIWSSNTHESFKTGMRYLLIQVGSGVLLLAGTILYYKQSGTIVFNKFELTEIGPMLIFIAFGIKAAFPPTSQLASRRLPSSNSYRNSIFIGVYYKISNLCIGPRFPRYGTSNLDWCNYDSVSNFLCCYRKRS